MRSAGFPLLERGYDDAPFIYLDSASTTPKPRGVIDAVVRYYETVGANVHRGTHPLAEAATEAYERARHRVAALIGAQPAEIVFTRNATDSFNLLARWPFWTWAASNSRKIESTSSSCASLPARMSWLEGVSSNMSTSVAARSGLLPN